MSELHACNNLLTGLPALPPSLTVLSVRDNRLGQLPRLPDSLTDLDICTNRLRELPALPGSLSMLMASDNALRSLPEFRGCLNVAAFDNNRLTTLPGWFETAVSGEYCNMTIFNNPLNRESITRVRELPISVMVLPDRPEQPLSVFEAATGLLREALGFDLFEVHREEAALRNAIAADVLGELSFPVAPFQSVQQPAAPAAVVQAPVRPLSDAVRHWSMSSGNQTDAGLAAWHAIETEQNAPGFSRFLDRLAGTREYRDTATRSALIAKVSALLASLHESPALRGLCFELAADASATCGDRVAFALNSMEMARINHDAEQGRLTTEALFDMRQGMFRLQVLDELATDKIAQLRADRAAKGDTTPVDEIEVRLGFQTLPAAELQLPGVGPSMLYERCADLPPAALTDAIDKVRQREQRNEFVQFMAHWTPWQQAMQRQHPQPYARLAEDIDTERNALLDDPVCMNDQDLLEAFAAQAQDEERALVKLTARLTREFIRAANA